MKTTYFTTVLLMFLSLNVSTQAQTPICDDLMIVLNGTKEPLVISREAVCNTADDFGKLLDKRDTDLASFSFILNTAKKNKITCDTFDGIFNDQLCQDQGDLSFFSNASYTKLKVELLFRAMKEIMKNAEKQGIVIPTKGDLGAAAQQLVGQAKKVALMKSRNKN